LPTTRTVCRVTAQALLQIERFPSSPPL
jgi:hypothetical protein